MFGEQIQISGDEEYFSLLTRNNLFKAEDPNTAALFKTRVAEAIGLEAPLSGAGGYREYVDGDGRGAVVEVERHHLAHGEMVKIIGQHRGVIK